MFGPILLNLLFIKTISPVDGRPRLTPVNGKNTNKMAVIWKKKGNKNTYLYVASPFLLNMLISNSMTNGKGVGP